MRPHSTDTRPDTAPSRFCACAAALLALAATPASAWTILADIDPDGNTLFDPAVLAGTGRPNGLIRRCECAPCRQAWLCFAPSLRG